MLDLQGTFLVRRSFNTAGGLVPKGTRITAPGWKNTAALVESGYLLPDSGAPVAAAPSAKPSKAPKKLAAKPDEGEDLDKGQ